MARETVEMHEKMFESVRKAVESGTMVVWQNTGPVNHDVTSIQFHDAAEK